MLGVEGAETIWDKVADDNISFDNFMDVLTNNLFVGISKLPEAKKNSLRLEIDNLCWMLCERTYVRRISSLSESETEAERKTRREFSSRDKFKLWKVSKLNCRFSANELLDR